ncbi:MAG: thiolase family protein [Aigarchaeota archaeon]|nr:thiolase family protein [Aigarchaeota archaeon]MDW8092791.1 thiolase family protein [Nitrososphaerota archaeon]
MRWVAVLGVGISRFGKRSEGLIDLLSESAVMALDDAGVEQVDELVVANMASGEFEGVSGVGSILVSRLGLEPARAYKVEATSGSGGAAIYVASNSILSGMSKVALVVGGEKMTTKETPEVSEVIASILDEDDRAHGLTLPSLAAFSARNYMREFGATRESLASIAVKNHYNGSLNPHAHFRKRITIEEVLSSPIVCDPLRIYDYCPISDGAAAVILADINVAKKYRDKFPVIRGIGYASDTNSPIERDFLFEMPAVRRAAEMAYAASKRGPRDIDIVELHDMATILEVIISEELGLFERGRGWKAAEEGVTSLDGELPINTSGGLKAKGHPIGATGVAQLVEVSMQLLGECGERQVQDAKVGLTCNVSGFGAGVTVAVVEVI